MGSGESDFLGSPLLARFVIGRAYLLHIYTRRSRLFTRRAAYQITERAAICIHAPHRA